jgi:hypothetical protein
MDVCRRVVADLVIDVGRPVILQVSRFDPWEGSPRCDRGVSPRPAQASGVQLVLAGMLAEDDPERRAMLDAVEKEAGDDPDREIKPSPHTVDIPVVTLTAFPIRAIKGGALETGARFVMKPCAPEDLEEQVCSLLGGRCG